MRWIRNAWLLYYDGFRSMTLGRTLWIIILIKLFIIFVVLKLFFFPNYIKEHASEGQEAEFVSRSLSIENVNGNVNVNDNENDNENDNDNDNDNANL